MESVQLPNVVNNSGVNEEIVDDKNEDSVTSSQQQVIQFLSELVRSLNPLF